LSVIGLPTIDGWCAHDRNKVPSICMALAAQYDRAYLVFRVYGALLRWMRHSRSRTNSSVGGGSAE